MTVFLFIYLFCFVVLDLIIILVCSTSEWVVFTSIKRDLRSSKCVRFGLLFELSPGQVWVASTDRASRKVDDAIATTSPAPRYRWFILEGCEMGVGEGRLGDLFAVKLLRGVYLFTAMSICKTRQQRIFQPNKNRARVKC